MGNVKFDNIAREWRCKWSADNDKAALSAAQGALDDVLADVSSVEGVQSVQRVVCGGCFDFKVVVKLSAAAFGDWEKSGFEPEKAFLAVLGSIEGLSAIETQTYTLEEVKMNKKDLKKAQEKKEKDEQSKKKEVEEAPKDPEKERKDRLKKVIKEGGKR